MAEDESGEKKHDPGEKKWKDAAERGELPKSTDINAAAVLVAGGTALVFGSAPIVRAVGEIAVRFFDGGGPYVLTIPDAHGIGLSALAAIGLAAAVPLGASMVASTFAGLAQTQGTVATKALEPKWERLDVLAGMKQAYFSRTPLIEFVKGAAKILAIAFAVGVALEDRIRALPLVATFPPEQQLAILIDLGWSALVAALPIILMIATIDYAASYYRSNEQLKRTDKEVKDDQKEQNGDPHMKAKRRQEQRRVAMSINLALVKTADVVVTNPTHFAVALRYRRDKDAAPQVLVKGIDHLALRIRAEALRSGVPRIEDRPLARALYRRCDMGAPIPEDLFAPVARVLAVVLRRRQERRS